MDGMSTTVILAWSSKRNGCCTNRSALQGLSSASGLIWRTEVPQLQVESASVSYSPCFGSGPSGIAERHQLWINLTDFAECVHNYMCVSFASLHTVGRTEFIQDI